MIHSGVPSNKRCTVAIIGAGAVGSYYGARLHEAGHDVRFFMRGPNLDTCHVNGLTVQSIAGDMHIPASELQTFSNTKDIGEVDWVVLGLKSTALQVVPALVRPCLGQHSRVLAIMNGFVDDQLVDLLPEARSVFGGMAFICVNRISPGVIHHSFYGPLLGGLARVDPNQQHELELLEQLWQPTKVPFTTTPTLLRGRWEKSAWNIPFSGLSVAMGGITIDQIVGDQGLRKLAKQIMCEVVAVANADLQAHCGGDDWEPLGEAHMTKMWDLSDNMGPYRPSTMIDLLAGKPIEVEYLFSQPLQRAWALGVEVPYMHMMVTQIEAIQRMRNLF